MFQIIDIIFVDKMFIFEKQEVDKWFVFFICFVKLICFFFVLLQLICLDFLFFFFNVCFFNFVDILYKFCIQDDEFNVVLMVCMFMFFDQNVVVDEQQIVIFFWVILDFFFGKGRFMFIIEDMIGEFGDEVFIKLVVDFFYNGLGVVLWMLFFL